MPTDDVFERGLNVVVKARYLDPGERVYVDVAGGTILKEPPSGCIVLTCRDGKQVLLPNIPYENEPSFIAGGV